jgi:hypothetical protein
MIKKYIILYKFLTKIKKINYQKDISFPIALKKEGIKGEI